MGDEVTARALVLRAGKARRLQCAEESGRGFGKAKRRTFIEVLAATCNVRLAAQACGVAVKTTYRARHADAGFAAEWDAALASGYHRLEAEALRYALERLPGAADPHGSGETDAARAAIAGSEAGAMVERRASDADLRFVLAILSRHARTVKGGGTIRVARPSEADTDARLCRLLDNVERQLAR